MVTFIPEGLTTRCKKSTKQEIEKGEFSLLWFRVGEDVKNAQFPERAFLSYVFASGFPNRYFLKNIEEFFPSLRY